MKGGVGKTTVAINIAHYLAEKLSKRVLIVDIDPQFNATQCLMTDQAYVKHMQDNKDTIISVFENECRNIISTVEGTVKQKNKDINEIETIEIRNNLYLLPGNLNLFQLEMAPGTGKENRLKQFLRCKNEEYEYVIIDTPPTPSVWMTSALIASDYYLIAVKPDPLSMTGIDLLNSIVNLRKNNYGLSIECIGIVLNMVEGNTIVFRDAIDYLSHDWRKNLLFKRSIPKRTSIAREQTSNKFILDLNDNESKIALSGIVNELIQRIDEKKDK